MSRGQPLQLLPWLVSRASGIVALVLVSLGVVLGLAMASRTVHRPAARRVISRLHEHIALVALAAIALHGVALLGDRWLKPGLLGISVPFALAYRPTYTGIGILAGYIVMLLGPSFYLRRRIGVRRWRRIHPVLIVAWLLAAAHSLGAGSDSGQTWLRLIVLAPLPAVAYLAVARLAGRNARPHAVTGQARASAAAVKARAPAALEEVAWPRAASARSPHRAG